MPVTVFPIYEDLRAPAPSGFGECTECPWNKRGTSATVQSRYWSLNFDWTPGAGQACSRLDGMGCSGRGLQLLICSYEGADAGMADWRISCKCRQDC